MSNDIRLIYLESGYDRKSITHTIPVLNGYQNGVCFYCGEQIEGKIHVDHVIPRQVIYHDEIWNLVLSHEFCNLQKSDYLPSMVYVEKLIVRNEHFISSKHPISNKLVEKLGKTPIARKKYILKVYEDVKTVLGGATWEGIRGYNPMTDTFYKTFIRSLKL